MIYQPDIKPNQPQNDIEVRHVATCRLPTQWGEFQMHGFEEVISGQEHVALTMGQVDDGQAVLTRVHSECLTGDALFSQRCDCGPQLQAAMQAVQKQGRGCIVYLRQEGRGIGLINKIRAYQLQDKGMDTVEANVALGLPVDARNFVLAKNILSFLHINDINLMTNNPQKVATLKEAGINVVSREPLIVGLNTENEVYLQTKHDKLGHLL